MAFAVRHYFRKKEMAGTNDWELKIYWDNWPYSQSDMVLEGETPFIVQSLGTEADLSHPIMGQEIILRIRSDTEGDYRHLAFAKHKEAYLQVLYNSSQRYKFWLDPGGYEENYKSPPHFVEARFVCGLGDLRGYKYVDGSGNPYTGYDSMLDIISKCLQKLELSLSYIRVYSSLLEDSMGTARSTNMLKAGEIQQDLFYDREKNESWNCYDVLDVILRTFQCRIIQFTDWYILRIPELAGNFEDYKYLYQYYDEDGTYAGLSGGASGGALSNDETVLQGVALDAVQAWMNGDQIVRWDDSWREFYVVFHKGWIKNVLSGSDWLNDYADYWTVSGSTTVAVIAKSDDEPERRAIELSSGYSTGIDGDPGYRHDGIQVEAGENILFKFSTKVDYSGTPGATEAGFPQVCVYLDADAGSGSDRWLNFQGTWLSSYTSNIGGNHFFFGGNVDHGSDDWKTFEVISDAIPYAGVLYIRLNKAKIVNQSGVTLNNTYYADVSLKGLYSRAQPDLSQDLLAEMPDDNIQEGENQEIYIGDLDEGGNELIFFNGGIRYSSAPTDNWIPYYATGITRAQYGPGQTIQEHYRDFIRALYYYPRKRLRGVLYRNSYDPRFGLRAVMLDDEIFISTSWSFNVFKGLVDVEMAEVPGITGVGDEVTGDWENDPTDGWGIFSWDGTYRHLDLTVLGGGGTQKCRTVNVVGYKGYQKFVLIADWSSHNGNHAEFRFGSAVYQLEDDKKGVPVVIDPGFTAGGSETIYFQASGGSSPGSCSYNDLVLELFEGINY